MVLGRMFWKKSGKAKEVSVKNFMTRLHWRLRKYRIREGRNLKELFIKFKSENVQEKKS